MLSIVVSETFGYLFDGIFHGLKDTKNFEKSISFLKSLGYNGVELPLMMECKDLIYVCKDILPSYKISVSAIATGHYYTIMKYSLNSLDEFLREKAIAVASSGLKICNMIDAPLIIGLLRGKEFTDKKNFKLVENSLRILDKKASDLGVKIVLEPLNRYESAYINTLKEAYKLIEEFRLEKTGILADTFHMNIEESDPCNSLKKVKDKLWHIHLADSNRWPPGYGHIDFKLIIKTLKNIGYERWLAIECLPKPSPKKVASESIRYLKAIMT
ncbi:MAG: sugar phosphate isomerase/epimerase family protein [Candidatus Micrarchaeia archaeon]